MIWKEIPIAPGYEASEGGDIRNIRTGKVLKPFNDKQQEYDRVSIYRDGNKKKMLVHYLVANAFLPEPPEGKPRQLDHLNTNIHDNRPANLQWVTEFENHNNPLTRFNREVARIKRAIASGKMSREEILRLVDAISVFR